MARKLVLLVEDNESARRLHADFLKSMSYQVVSGVNGLDALRLLERVKPDVILLDIMMPELDGISACRQIREKFGDATPIIFLTAAYESETVRKALAAGGNDYVIKSGNLSGVLERVEYWTALDPLDVPTRRQAAVPSLS